MHIENQINGRVLASCSTTSIIESDAKYYILDKELNEGDIITFNPSKSKFVFPSLFNLLVSALENDEITDEELSMFSNLSQKHW